MTLVECPCCKGRKRFPVYEQAAHERGAQAADGLIAVALVDCCHCMGKGQVAAAEDVQHVPNDFGEVATDPRLQRGELTPQAKREHLRDAYKFMAEDEIEKIIAELYPHGGI